MVKHENSAANITFPLSHRYHLLYFKWKMEMVAIRGGRRATSHSKCHNFSILGGTFPFVYDSVVNSIFTVKYHSPNSVEGLLGPVLGGARLARFLDAQVFRRIKVPGQVFLHSIVKKEGEQCYALLVRNL